MTRGLRYACSVVGHRRSRRRAYLDPSQHIWRSYCRRCGAPMRKDWPKGWKAQWA